MMAHSGGCHCGKIAFEFDGEIGAVLDCNCSLCQKRGVLLHFIPASAFTLKTPRENLGISPTAEGDNGLDHRRPS